MVRKRVRFYVDSEHDADVVDWLGQQSNRSAAIREAIRAQMGRAASGGGLDTDTVRRIIREELARVAVRVGETQESPDATEDEETAEMMDGLLGAWDFDGEGE
jgi:hypothetical protein